jgi:hypothetical protein
MAARTASVAVARSGSPRLMTTSAPLCHVSCESAPADEDDASAMLP